eukprot:TRINITY_DN122_c0_g1_i1.p1 TRINITY_DN122_c0_g1~~TRINITY_DN122_c0_g1_i1.p1  ORF type:complete len:519 (-),score=49.89 TRINITY_DN122_c0_g1_i1:75-1631(-)
MVRLVQAGLLALVACCLLGLVAGDGLLIWPPPWEPKPTPRQCFMTTPQVTPLAANSMIQLYWNETSYYGPENVTVFFSPDGDQFNATWTLLWETPVYPGGNMLPPFYVPAVTCPSTGKAGAPGCTLVVISSRGFHSCAQVDITYSSSPTWSPPNPYSSPSSYNAPEAWWQPQPYWNPPSSWSAPNTWTPYPSNSPGYTPYPSNTPGYTPYPYTPYPSNSPGSYTPYPYNSPGSYTPYPYSSPGSYTPYPSNSPTWTPYPYYSPGGANPNPYNNPPGTWTPYPSNSPGTWTPYPSNSPGTWTPYPTYAPGGATPNPWGNQPTWTPYPYYPPMPYWNPNPWQPTPSSWTPTSSWNPLPYYTPVGWQAPVPYEDNSHGICRRFDELNVDLTSIQWNYGTGIVNDTMNIYSFQFDPCARLYDGAMLINQETHSKLSGIVAHTNDTIYFGGAHGQVLIRYMNFNSPYCMQALHRPALLNYWLRCGQSTFSMDSLDASKFASKCEISIYATTDAVCGVTKTADK